MLLEMSFQSYEYVCRMAQLKYKYLPSQYNAMQAFESDISRFWVPAMPLTSYVISDELFYLSEIQFPHP